MVLEPGVVTNDINEVIAEKGLFYAGYPMSVETCFIGGNVAENAGDGNLHATLVKNPESTIEEWYDIEVKALKELYQAAKKLGGTLSGEHGIGSKQKHYWLKR